MCKSRAYIYKTSHISFVPKAINFVFFCTTFAALSRHSLCLSITRFMFQFDAHFLSNCTVFAMQFHLPVICLFLYMCACDSIHHLVMRQQEKFRNKWNACTFFPFSLNPTLFRSHPSMCIRFACIEEFCCPVWRNHLGKSYTICFIFPTTDSRISRTHTQTHSSTKCTE